MKFIFFDYKHLLYVNILLSLSIYSTNVTDQLTQLRVEIQSLKKDIFEQCSRLVSESYAKSKLVKLVNALNQNNTSSNSHDLAQLNQATATLALNEIHKKSIKEKKEKVNELTYKYLSLQCNPSYWQSLPEDEKYALAFKVCCKLNNNAAFKAKHEAEIQPLLQYMQNEIIHQRLSYDLEKRLHVKINDATNEIRVDTLSSLLHIQQAGQIVKEPSFKEPLTAIESQIKRLESTLKDFEPSFLSQKDRSLCIKLNQCKDLSKQEMYLAKLARIRIYNSFGTSIADTLRDTKNALTFYLDVHTKKAEIVKQIKQLDLQNLDPKTTIQDRAAYELQRLQLETQLINTLESPRKIESPRLSAVRQSSVSPCTNMHDTQIFLNKRIEYLQEDISTHKTLLTKMLQENPQTESEQQDQQRRIKEITTYIQKISAQSQSLLETTKNMAEQNIKIIEEALKQQSPKKGRRSRSSSLLSQTHSCNNSPNNNENHP